jgi:hypothetical protein
MSTMIADDTRVDFLCPHCDAGYRVVRIKRELSTTFPPVRCRMCRMPLPATDGGDFLKYFLVSRRSPKS